MGGQKVHNVSNFTRKEWVTKRVIAYNTSRVKYAWCIKLYRQNMGGQRDHNFTCKVLYVMTHLTTHSCGHSVSVLRCLVEWRWNDVTQLSSYGANSSIIIFIRKALAVNVKDPVWKFHHGSNMRTCVKVGMNLSSPVQSRIRTVCLFGSKPLPEPMLAHCQLDSWEHIPVNLNGNSIMFIEEYAFEIVVCQNGGLFVQGKMSQVKLSLENAPSTTFCIVVPCVTRK